MLQLLVIILLAFLLGSYSPVVRAVADFNDSSSENGEDVLSRFSGVFSFNSSTNCSKEMVEGTLSDPGDCVFGCWTEENAGSDQAGEENADKLAETILLTIASRPNFTRSDLLVISPAELEKISIENLGPTFERLCEISRKADQCYSRCPQSQLRNVTVNMRYNSDVFCEPQKNWNNFTECYRAFACINRTLANSTCESECGRDLNPRDYVHLQVRNETRPTFVLQTDGDLTEQLDPICRSNYCYVDCNKAAIVERCGIREYGLYLRLKKYDVKSLVTVAKDVQGASANSAQCQRFL